MAKLQLFGSYVALVTPFTDSDEVFRVTWVVCIYEAQRTTAYRPSRALVLYYTTLNHY